MTIQRMDDVGIVVDDLAAAQATTSGIRHGPAGIIIELAEQIG